MKKALSILLTLVLIMLSGCSGRTSYSGIEYSDENYFDSMISDTVGFRLVTGSPAATQMSKVWQKTQDGGKTWTDVKDISTDVKNYPVDVVCWSETEGLILTDYHSVREYIYLTSDGGNTWTGIYVGEDADIYTNGVSAEYDADKDMITVKVAVKDEEDKDDYAQRTYVSYDHGVSWKLK